LFFLLLFLLYCIFASYFSVFFSHCRLIIPYIVKNTCPWNILKLVIFCFCPIWLPIITQLLHKFTSELYRKKLVYLFPSL
jgi:hypothetical protein